MTTTRREFLSFLGIAGLLTAVEGGWYLYEEYINEPAEEVEILRLKGLAFFWESIKRHNPDVFRVFENNEHLFHRDDPDSIAKVADLHLPPPEKKYVRFLLDALLPKDAVSFFDKIRNRENIIREFQGLHEKIHVETVTFKFDPKDRGNVYLLPEQRKTTYGGFAFSNVVTICGNADFDNPGMLRDVIREIPSSSAPSGDFRDRPWTRRKGPLGHFGLVCQKT